MYGLMKKLASVHMILFLSPRFFQTEREGNVSGGTISHKGNAEIHVDANTDGGKDVVCLLGVFMTLIHVLSET